MLSICVCHLEYSLIAITLYWENSKSGRGETILQTSGLTRSFELIYLLKKNQ